MHNGDGEKDYSKISVVIQGNPPVIPKKKIIPPSPQRNYKFHDSSNNNNSLKSPHYDKMMEATNGGNMQRAAATTTAHSRGRRDSNTSDPSRSRLWSILRLFALDLPLGVVFATLLSVYAIRNIYQDLYVPLMDRATRTDSDLDSEFTYFHRYCTEADLTTRDIHDLVTDAQAPVARGVQQMMEHGAVVLRDLLSQETVRKLREYAVYRNTHIPDEEVYPVSQGHNRMSFGYDATDSPIVVQALKELANNRYLKQLLSEILGDVSRVIRTRRQQSCGLFFMFKIL